MERKAVRPLILALSLVAGTGCLQAEENIEELEARHTAAIQSFEAETRAELNRIARSESLTGEEKIILIEQWFTANATRIGEINFLADTLDRTSPLSRPAPPALPADLSPEGTTAADLHTLSRRFSIGEITAAEFHNLRAPLLASLAASADAEKLRVTPARLIALPPLPGSEATPEQLARILHVHNRHLSTLPPQDAAAIRANPQSPVNLIPGLIQAKPTLEQTGQSPETSTNQPSPTR